MKYIYLLFFLLCSLMGISQTVTGVTSTTSNGSYKQGQTIAITIGFTSAVYVRGTTQLTLETGVNDAVVNYSSGSGGNSLNFNYTCLLYTSPSPRD